MFVSGFFKVFDPKSLKNWSLSKWWSWWCVGCGARFLVAGGGKASLANLSGVWFWIKSKSRRLRIFRALNSIRIVPIWRVSGRGWLKTAWLCASAVGYLFCAGLVSRASYAWRLLVVCYRKMFLNFQFGRRDLMVLGYQGLHFGNQLALLRKNGQGRIIRKI